MKYVCCIGNFDGVHLGHKVLIDRVVEAAGDNFIPAVITFSFGEGHKCLTTDETKNQILYSMGIQEIITIPFDKEFSLIPKNIFINYFLNRMDIETLICGKDFTFGNNAEGTSEYLKNYDNKNFNVEVLDELNVENRKVSSTWIKELISEGNIKKANELLGHNYTITCQDNILPPAGAYIIASEEGTKRYKFNPENKIKKALELIDVAE